MHTGMESPRGIWWKHMVMPRDDDLVAYLASLGGAR